MSPSDRVTAGLAEDAAKRLIHEESIRSDAHADVNRARAYFAAGVAWAREAARLDAEERSERRVRELTRRERRAVGRIRAARDVLARPRVSWEADDERLAEVDAVLRGE